VALAAAGLALGRVLGVFSPDAVPGTVVHQAPAPGVAVAPATPVQVLVALAGSAPAFVMPDLVYRDYDEVRRFFEARGFHFGNVKFEPYPGVADGVILRQFPLAGHPVARADAVSLVVATAVVPPARG
jgi:beta-lactam-binding protein with PASTA domain